MSLNISVHVTKLPDGDAFPLADAATAAAKDTRLRLHLGLVFLDGKKLKPLRDLQWNTCANLDVCLMWSGGPALRIGFPTSSARDVFMTAVQHAQQKSTSEQSSTDEQKIGTVAAVATPHGAAPLILQQLTEEDRDARRARAARCAEERASAANLRGIGDATRAQRMRDRAQKDVVCRAELARRPEKGALGQAAHMQVHEGQPFTQSSVMQPSAKQTSLEMHRTNHGQQRAHHPLVQTPVFVGESMELDAHSKSDDESSSGTESSDCEYAEGLGCAKMKPMAGGRGNSVAGFEFEFDNYPKDEYFEQPTTHAVAKYNDKGEASLLRNSNSRTRASGQSLPSILRELETCEALDDMREERLNTKRMRIQRRLDVMTRKAV